MPEAIGHGAFTRHMIEYLTGKAGPDRYPRDEVSVEELVPFARACTRESVGNLLGAGHKPESLASDRRPGEFVENTLDMKLVAIPAVEFAMDRAEPNEYLKQNGFPSVCDTSDERPVHRVRMTKPFLNPHVPWYTKSNPVIRTGATPRQ